MPDEIPTNRSVNNFPQQQQQQAVPQRAARTTNGNLAGCLWIAVIVAFFLAAGHVITWPIFIGIVVIAIIIGVVNNQ